MQERPVGLGHCRLLGPTDGISLLLVRDGPAFLGLAQLLQAVVEALLEEATGQSGGSKAGFDVGRAHLELVFDDLSLFVLQLWEEQVPLGKPANELTGYQRRRRRRLPWRRAGRRACSSPTDVP